MDLDLREVIFWVAAGGLAGWLASVVTGTGKRMGCLLNIIVGVIGAAVGGWVFREIIGRPKDVGPGRFLASVGVAFVGAVIVLVIMKILRKN